METSPREIGEPEEVDWLGCDPPGVLAFSPSQVESWLLCQRKWGWAKLAKIKGPQHPSAKLGDETHKQLEGFLAGKPLDFTQPAGYIAASGTHHLPEPCSPGLEIEGSFRFQSKRGYVWNGRIDLACPTALVPWNETDEACRGAGDAIPSVTDHKTTGNLRWAKSRDDLLFDVQANLYAFAVMAKERSPVVDLFWNYMQTKGARAAKRTHLRMYSPHVARNFVHIENIADGMAQAELGSPGPEETQAVEAYVKSLPINTDACGAFGGCPYQHKCNLSPQESMRSLMSNGFSLDSLKKRATAQDAPASPVVPATVAAPAPEPVQEALPAWATAPVDPMSLRKGVSPKPVAAAGTATIQPAGVVVVPAASAAPVAINPPESLLPLPVLPPEPVLTFEAKEGANAEPVITVASVTKKPRGRPRKNPAPDPVAADVHAHLHDAVAVDAGGTVAAPVQAPDNTADVYTLARMAGEEPRRVLYIDCLPDSPVVDAGEYVERAKAIVSSTCKNEKGELVADYRFLPFGQAGGALLGAFKQAFSEDPPASGELALNTGMVEASIILSYLTSTHDFIVRSVK